jgi:very-short-patch-repair endonuclease
VNGLINVKGENQLNNKKHYSQYVAENIDLEYQWINDTDMLMDAPYRGKKARMYSTKMSELEKIFFLSMYYYINTPPFRNDYTDWMSTFYLEYKHTGKASKPLLRFQYKCGKYKIDFAIIRKYCKIAIELDGFKWHDRNKDQFAYERERQNYLVSKGFIVLRYTWQAVTKDWLSVQCEIMKTIEKELNKYCKGAK